MLPTGTSARTIEAADHRDCRVASDRDAGDVASYAGCAKRASRCSAGNAAAADPWHRAAESSQALAATTAPTVRAPWRRCER